jgi:hypothetical protein
VLKLAVTQGGKPNYIFWKESKSTQNGDVNFNLNDIIFKNCRLSYLNLQKDIQTNLEVKMISLQGNFRNNEYKIESKGKLLLHDLSVNGHTFLRDKDLGFAFGLDVHGPKFNISQGSAEVNNLKVQLHGALKIVKGIESAKLQFKCPDLDLQSLLSLLPSGYHERISDYKSTGLFLAEGSFEYQNSGKYNLYSKFGIKNAEVKYKPNDIKLSKLHLNGSLNFSEESSNLEISDLSGNLEGDQINGRLKIVDFKDPLIAFSAMASLDLKNLNRFFPIDTLDDLSGVASLNVSAEGLLADLREQTFSEKVKVSVDANIKNLSTKFKHDQKEYKVEECQLLAVDRSIEVRNLKLKRGESDFLINGKVPGLFNYLLDRNQPLVISGKLSCDYLKLDDFLEDSHEGKRTSTTTSVSLIPKNVKLDLVCRLERFSLGKFNASDITGVVEIHKQKAIISDFTFKSMKGSAKVDAYLDNSHQNLELVLQSQLNDIDINQLFRELNNFGQNTIEDKHLKGSATATVEFAGRWNNELQADPKAIMANCNLLIENGELNGFQPLMSLSKFVAVKDLEHIKFSTLQSNISIRDRVISFPKTSIRNSALNVDIWGTHSFDNQIDYHIQMLLSELLASPRNKQDNEFGEVANDPSNRRMAFILMTGTVDDPKIRYDRKGMKQKVREDIKAEKQNLKQILKEEIGMFKKDSTLTTSKNEKVTFKLEEDKPAPKPKELQVRKRPEEEDF